IFDNREVLLQRFEGLQDLKQRLSGDGFDDQLVPLFSDDGIFARKFELPRDAHRSIATIPEDFHVTWNTHGRVTYAIAYAVTGTMSTGPEETGCKAEICPKSEHSGDRNSRVPALPRPLSQPNCKNR